MYQGPSWYALGKVWPHDRACGMSERRETGACFCGAIAAEMTGEPFWICYDHDDDCRRAIGSPLTVWVGYRPAQVRFTRGTPKTFSRTRGVVRSFCGDCGSAIDYRDEGTPDELYLAIGFLAGRRASSPKPMPTGACAYPGWPSTTACPRSMNTRGSETQPTASPRTANAPAPSARASGSAPRSTATSSRSRRCSAQPSDAVDSPWHTSSGGDRR